MTKPNSMPSFKALPLTAFVVFLVLIAQVSYEFPSLIGGLVGVLLTIALAKYNIGLEKSQSDKKVEAVKLRPLLKATFPLWGTVLILVLTRIPQLGIKPLLLLGEPNIVIELGALGTFSISAALVLSLKGILNTVESWSHALL